MSERGAEQTIGYLELLRGNRNFRHLFVAQLISLTGDWFNTVALFTLLLNLTGSGEAVAFVLILKLLPTFFIGPLAGVVADRFDRKAIMIASDIARGLLVLGFLLIERADQVWIVYAITALEIAASAFFEPARSAALPAIVKRGELISANALSGAAWSVTLALGAAAGGVVTDAFGTDTAFAIDAASFFVSAVFVWLTRFASSPDIDRRGKARLSIADMTGITDFIEGARYLRSNSSVLALLLVKSGWGLGGGVLLLLTIFGRQIFPMGRDGSTSIGLFYAARGVGAMIGPMIARAVGGTSPRTMRQAITLSFFVSAIFYLLLAQAPILVVALACVIGAHMGGSIQWVYSTTLLQMYVPDRFLGRVFALDLALVTLTMSISTYFTGWGLDSAGFSARTMATALGLSFVVPGIIFLVIDHRLSGLRSEAEGSKDSAIGGEPATETSFPPA